MRFFKLCNCACYKRIEPVTQTNSTLAGFHVSLQGTGQRETLGTRLRLTKWRRYFESGIRGISLFPDGKAPLLMVWFKSTMKWIVLVNLNKDLLLTVICDGNESNNYLIILK